MQTAKVVGNLNYTVRDNSKLGERYLIRQFA